jgi:hypothetical protein
MCITTSKYVFLYESVFVQRSKGSCSVFWERQVIKFSQVFIQFQPFLLSTSSDVLVHILNWSLELKHVCHEMKPYSPIYVLIKPTPMPLMTLPIYSVASGWLPITLQVYSKLPAINMISAWMRVDLGPNVSETQKLASAVGYMLLRYSSISAQTPSDFVSDNMMDSSGLSTIWVDGCVMEG